jgi:hypothetical protein
VRKGKEEGWCIGGNISYELMCSGSEKGWGFAWMTDCWISVGSLAGFASKAYHVRLKHFWCFGYDGIYRLECLGSILNNHPYLFIDSFLFDLFLQFT